MALSEQEILRREALTELRNLGIEPYPAAEFTTTAYSSKILANFEKYEGKEVILAGRLMGKRIMGKASFAELKDAEGRIQVYVSRDDISDDEEKTMYNVVFKKAQDKLAEVQITVIKVSSYSYIKYTWSLKSRFVLNKLLV